MRCMWEDNIMPAREVNRLYIMNMEKKLFVPFPSCMASIEPIIVQIMKYHGLRMERQHEVSKRRKQSLHHEHALTDFTTI